MTGIGAFHARAQARTQERSNRAAGSIWHHLGRGLSWGLLLLVISLGVVTVGVPKATGAVPLAVLTSSMEPRLPPGTLIIIRPVQANNLRVGDVATYQITSGRPEVITHRITAVNTSSDGTRTFTFQGDNNTDPDTSQVLPEQVRGELWYSLPLLGFASVALNGVDRAVVVPVIGALLLLYSAASTVSGLVTAGRKRRAKKISVSEDIPRM